MSWAVARRARAWRVGWRDYVVILTIALATVAVRGFGVGADADADRLYAAVRSGRTADLKALLDHGADPNARSDRGVTPLMNATVVGNLDAMRLLLAHGADVDARSSDAGATALMWAVDDPARIALVLAAGADPNIEATGGRTALMFASATHRSTPILSQLLARGARLDAAEQRTGFTAAVGALANGDTDADRLLSSALVRESPRGANGLGFTPLMIAAATGNTDAVTRLLAQGADVNVAMPMTDPNNRVKAGSLREGGYTPLLLASTYGPPALVQALLDAGANVDAQDVRGMTPLMMSLTTDRPNVVIVKTLLAYGANTRLKNIESETAADWARKFGDVEAMKLLHATRTGTPLVRVRREPTDIRSSVERGVHLLEATASRFVSTGGCFSCHAQAAALIAQAAARAKGAAVDEAAGRVLLEQTIKLAMPLPTQVMHRQMWKPMGQADQMLFAFDALARSGYPSSRQTDFIAAEVAMEQWPAGHWHGNGGVARAPLEDGDFSRTAMAIRVLKTYVPPARAEESAARLRRARDWLLAAVPVTTDDAAMQLIGAALAGAPIEDLRSLAARLVRLQRCDGGWSQRRGFPSDAYATGLVLTAFAESRTLDPGDAACARGRQFLLGTQASDGSWHVVSRALRIQPYFESGFPYGADQWISSMATAWAVNALAAALAPPAGAEQQADGPAGAR